MSTLPASDLPGGAEQPIDPPEQREWSERELRELDDAARRGFDAHDEHAANWMGEQLADTPTDVRVLVYTALTPGSIAHHSAGMRAAVYELRDRYIAECAEDYWPDLMDQAAHAQEA